MIIRTFAVATLAMCLSACATPQGAPTEEISDMPVSADIHATSPVMAHNADSLLLGEVWKRSELSARDRSLATVAVLIAKGQTAELAAHLDLALKNGVTPLELSETINHLAFYSGWGNAAGAMNWSVVRMSKACWTRGGCCRLKNMIMFFLRNGDSEPGHGISRLVPAVGFV